MPDSTSQPCRRRGFTLVEMMVSTAISLILILAVVESFRVIGEAVAEGRASLSMSGQLRTVTNRLQDDLRGISAPVRSWALRGSGLGYLEIGEGIVSDSYNLGPDGMPGAAGVDDDGQNGIDDYFELGTTGTDDTSSLLATSMLGDFDDYIAFTARSREGQFVGRVIHPGWDLGWGVVDVDDDGDGTTDEPDEFLYPGSDDISEIRSNEAEIIWWVALDDRNKNGRWDPLPLETFTIRRRVLLIVPDLNRHPGIDGKWGEAGVDDNNNGVTDEIGEFAWPGSDDRRALFLSGANVLQLQNAHDISAHLDPSSGLCIGNTLEDLALRHNRVAHLPGPLNFPNYTGYHPGPDGGWGVANTDDDGNGSTDDLFEIGLGDDLVLFPWYRGARFGEDVVMSNVLGFDIRVFDPLAAVRMFDHSANDSGDEEALVPGDPAYGPGLPVIGRGAYVDLFYGRIKGLREPNVPQIPMTNFSDAPHRKSQLNPHFPAAAVCRLVPPFAIYDTWTMAYESDGLNQDGDADTDEGNDGQDNPNPLAVNNAVDDVGERETSPPYPFPLRGIQISVRVYDPDSRQVRQVTVVNDFTPE